MPLRRGGRSSVATLQRGRPAEPGQHGSRQGGGAVAGPELAGSGRGADLVDDLEIDRLPGFKIELDQHSGLTVL